MKTKKLDLQPAKSDTVLRPDSCNELQVFSNAHDVRVRDLLDQVNEYRKDHPGLVRNLRLRESTVVAVTPDDGRKVLDELEKNGSGQVRVLRNVCNGDVAAVFLKESTIDINFAESEQ